VVNHASEAPGLEKHIQTLIQVVLVALLLWSGSSTLELKDRMVRVEEKLTSLQGAANDRYTRTQAAYEIGSLRRDIEGMDKDSELEHARIREWMQSLRDRVIALEAFARTKGFNPDQYKPETRKETRP